LNTWNLNIDDFVHPTSKGDTIDGHLLAFLMDLALSIIKCCVHPDYFLHGRTYYKIIFERGSWSSYAGDTSCKIFRKRTARVIGPEVIKTRFSNTYSQTATRKRVCLVIIDHDLLPEFRRTVQHHNLSLHILKDAKNEIKNQKMVLSRISGDGRIYFRETISLMENFPVTRLPWFPSIYHVYLQYYGWRSPSIFPQFRIIIPVRQSCGKHWYSR